MVFDERRLRNFRIRSSILRPVIPAFEGMTVPEEDGTHWLAITPLSTPMRRRDSCHLYAAQALLICGVHSWPLGGYEIYIKPSREPAQISGRSARRKLHVLFPVLQQDQSARAGFADAALKSRTSGEIESRTDDLGLRPRIDRADWLLRLSRFVVSTRPEKIGSRFSCAHWRAFDAAVATSRNGVAAKPASQLSRPSVNDHSTWGE